MRRYTMGVSDEPVLLPGPYDGQPTLAPMLAGMAPPGGRRPGGG